MGYLMIKIGLSCMFYYWCCPMVLSVSCKREGFPLQGLQYAYDLLMVGGVSDKSPDLSKWVVAYGSKEDLILQGFYLNDLQQLRMLARVSIRSAYDPSRESMLAYASPSNKIAIMITGLVIDCLGKNNFLVTKSSLLKLIQLCLHLKQPLLFICMLFIILLTYPKTPTKYFQFHTCSR